MPDIEPLNLNSSAMTQTLRETWFDRIAALTVIVLGLCSMTPWWPRFSNYSRFGFLCCFPAVFPFGYALVRSASSRRDTPRIRKALGIMIAVHCALLLGVVFVWRALPVNVSIENPDFVFVLMALEVAVMIVLVRILRPTTANG